MEAPGTPVVARFPSVIVPVCVVKGVSAAGVLKRALCVTETPCVEETPCVSGVVAGVPKCVPSSTPCVSEGVCVTEAPCMSETPRVSVTACVSSMARVSEQPGVSEARCVRGTACVRSLCVREMTVGMREHATACPSVMEWCVSVVTRGSLSAWVEWRRRRRQRDKGRVAAVAVLGTAPGLHGGEREVRAVLRTRPPRARLRR